MHFIKRAAFRALAAPSSAFARSAVPSSTPFAIRNQAAVVSAFKRFNSTENKPAEEQTIVEKATEAASEIVSQAKEAVQERAAEFNAPRERGERQERQFTPRAPPSPNSTVYIGNLIFEATPAELEEAFGKFGEIKSVRIAQDARGLSKGFAYVEFANVDAATAAIEAMHMNQFGGRTLVVNYGTSTPRRSAVAQNPPAKTLFIGNLAFEMTDADLNKLFRDIKNVIDVRVAIDRRTGQPRGFAHADFTDVESAVEAMKVLQGKSVYDRTLRVDYSAARQRSNRTQQRERDAPAEDSSF